MPTRHAQTLRAVLQLFDLLVPCRHAPGFGSVLWYGTYHVFTGAQARIVALLWEAWANGTPDVRQEDLLNAAGSAGRKIANLFRGHAAWGTMIVPGAVKGLYRLEKPDTPEIGPSRDLGAKPPGV